MPCGAQPGSRLPRARPALPRQLVLDRVRGSQAGDRLDLGHLDELAPSSLEAVTQGGQRSDDGVLAVDDVDDPVGLHEGSVGVAVLGHAGQLFDVVGEADMIAPRTLQTEGRHPDHHDVRD